MIQRRPRQHAPQPFSETEALLRSPGTLSSSDLPLVGELEKLHRFPVTRSSQAFDSKQLKIASYSELCPAGKQKQGSQGKGLGGHHAGLLQRPDGGRSGRSG